ncbi:MAG TPA: hypothetical protein VJ728_02070 [Candidatus Binataceae bacterium]|nr:hypothetical protein [Candidatus Binataceae bacterium]
MARDETHTSVVSIEPTPSLERPPNFTTRLFQPLVRRPWSALERLRTLRKERGHFSEVNPGAHSGGASDNEVFDRDVTKDTQITRNETCKAAASIEPHSSIGQAPNFGTHSLGRRSWSALERLRILRKERGHFSPVHLGVLSGERSVDEVFDGDIRIDAIGSRCNVKLESRHGNITIARNIEEGARVNLKAAGSVGLGGAIQNQTKVRIVAQEDVNVGQGIERNCQAAITATAGKIEIHAGVDQSEVNLVAGTTVHISHEIGNHSNVRITAQNDITIDGEMSEQATADIISLHGAITIGGLVSTATAFLSAGRSVHLREEIDHSARVTIMAQDDVSIGQKIEQGAVAQITSVYGSINIGQGLRGGASATLIATNGSINIGAFVDESSTVNWDAKDFNCPHPAGSIKHVASMQV